MATQLASTASTTTSTANGATGGLSNTALGSVTSLLQGGLQNLLMMGYNILDKFLPPSRREELKQKLIKFASEKPYLASFILSQIAFSAFPMFLFVTMTITVAIVALVAGILVGLLGAVAFILVAVGFALVILFPTLMVTTFAGVGLWLWGMGAYYLVKWFNQKEVPGIHVPMSESLKQSTGLGDLTKGLTSKPAGGSGEKSGGGGGAAAGGQKQQQPQANGHVEKEKTPQQANGSAEKPRHREKKAKKQDLPSVQDFSKQAEDVPGQVTSQVSGVTNQLGL